MNQFNSTNFKYVTSCIYDASFIHFFIDDDAAYPQGSRSQHFSHIIHEDKLMFMFYDNTLIHIYCLASPQGSISQSVKLFIQ